MFGDEQLDVRDRLLKAYVYPTPWVNRLVLGDSVVVINSLLEYERLGGQVQMIYMDPPYNVEFGSNFQPFVRRRDVRHGDDENLSREPETVQAYRDTWELGLHSYLTYLRDRFKLCRDLLDRSGSLFVQINDGNLPYVRTLLDEAFGSDCFVVTIAVKKKGGQRSGLIDPVNGYVVWYSRSPRSGGEVRFHPLYEKRELDGDTLAEFKQAELPDGRQFPISAVPDPEGVERDYRLNPKQLFENHPGIRLFRSNLLTSGGERTNQSTALLKLRQMTFSRHSAAIAAFGREFVVTALFAREHHKALIEAFELRQLADYSPGVGVGEQRARRLVDQAAAFVRDAEAHIRAQSG